MSRIQTGSMDVLHQSIDVGELIGSAVHSLGPRGEEVVVDVSASATPRPDRPGTARTGGGQSGRQCPRPCRRYRSADRSGGGGRPGRHPGHRPGSGHPPEDRDRVFQPFQRLGDSASRGGVGLGLAVARGFVEAVGGELDVEDTPGGGLTMVVRIPEVGAVGTGPPLRFAGGGAIGTAIGGDPASRGGRTGPTPGSGRMSSAHPTSAAGSAAGRPSDPAPGSWCATTTPRCCRPCPSASRPGATRWSWPAAAKRASTRPPSATPIWSCSTWGCRVSTEWRSSGPSGPGAPCRSSCCRPATRA